MFQAQHFSTTFAWDRAQTSKPQHQLLLFVVWMLAPGLWMQKSWHQCQKVTRVGQPSSDNSKRNHCRCLLCNLLLPEPWGHSYFMLLSFLSSRNLCFLKWKLWLKLLLSLPAATALRERPNVAVKLPGLAVVCLWPEAVQAITNLPATGIYLCRSYTCKYSVPFGLQLKTPGSTPS